MEMKILNGLVFINGKFEKKDFIVTMIALLFVLKFVTISM